MSIAFFDLDRTILSVNSGTGWVIREWRTGRLGSFKLLHALGWLAQYGLGLSDLESAIRRAVHDLKGQSESDIRRRSEAYWHDTLVTRIRSDARLVIDQHRERGDRLVLLSGTSFFLATCAMKELGLHAILCNRFDVSDGIFTGKCIEPIAFGVGKTQLAKQHAQQVGVSLSECTFYTDSYSDIDTLEKVGFPMVVCPDQRLRRAAIRAQWPIYNWS